jgi:hypothetical protein
MVGAVGLLSNLEFVTLEIVRLLLRQPARSS